METTEETTGASVWASERQMLTWRLACRKILGARSGRKGSRISGERSWAAIELHHNRDEVS